MAGTGALRRFGDSPAFTSHLKAMLIDDEALIVGSSNFDFLSHRIQQEVIAIVRNPQLIAEFRRDVLEPDLAQSVAPSRTIDPRWEWWKHQGTLGGAWLTVRLSRLGRARPAEGRGGLAAQPADEDPEQGGPSLPALRAVRRYTSRLRFWLPVPS